MASFSYKAISRQGQRKEGVVQASNRKAALDAVRKLGLSPLSVKEEKDNFSSSGNGGKKQSIWNMRVGGKDNNVMTNTEVLLFTSELADLLESGMTLGQALQSLANQGDEYSAQRRVCSNLNERIIGGESFSQAVAAHPKSFPTLYVNMIYAGEASGALVDVLHRLVEHYERMDSMKSKIKGAMTYPICVMFVGVGAIIVALCFIVPRFKMVFDSCGGELPATTQLLVSMSDNMLEYGWIYAIVTFLLIVWFKKWKKSENGRQKIDSWKLKMPLIKGIVATGQYSSLAFTLQTLLANGVKVLEALRISEQVCDNAVISKALSVARQRVTDGTSISAPLAASNAFPKLMTDMLTIGEKAGSINKSLGHIGQRYQKEMDRNISKLTNALGPIMIGVISIVVGFIAVAIISAVFQLSSAMASGR